VAVEIAVDSGRLIYEVTMHKQPLMAQAIAIGFTSLILTNMYEVSKQASTIDSLPLHAEADLDFDRDGRNSPRHWRLSNHPTYVVFDFATHAKR
jgi:hypothetical protein